MALTLLFEGSVPKHVGSPNENEDALRTAPDRGRLVVSDGASESFDARSWAHLLVARMIDEDLSLDTVTGCVKEYEALHDPNSFTWSKAAAYERGSFATLLVAQDQPERSAVRVTSVGDSLAVLVNGDKLMASVPYSDSEQFNDRPILLATRLAMNPTGERHWTTWEWGYEAQGYRLLCMTDALGAWLLAHDERGDVSALETLLGMRNFEEFVNLVETERCAGRLRRDDTTLIIAALSQ